MILSMTSIPSRISHIKPVLEALTRQTVPTQVHLTLPCYCPRTEDLVSIPRFLYDENIQFTVIRDDPGSILKLLGGIWYLDEDLIITVDDDVLYPSHFVEVLLAYHEMYPDQALCFRGKKKDHAHYSHCTLYHSHAITSPMSVDIITGTWGALYQRRWFDDHPLEPYLQEELSTVDDMIISQYLSDQGIESLCLPLQGIRPAPGIFNIDSLWEINRQANYNNEGMQLI